MQEYSATTASASGRPRSRSITVFIALMAFILGAALVGWATSRGYLQGVLTAPDAQETTEAVAETLEEPSALADAATTPAPQTPAAQMAAISSVEGRLAMLEDRISRLDFQTDAASGNAARAEGLLIAFAARRMIDRGEPLSYVADQLKLRFMNAQPRAVDTIIAFSKNPVTIDELSARLEALSPGLTGVENKESLWERARHELGALFVIRRDSSTLVSPSARIDRAKVMLTAKRISKAVAEVERLPGAAQAQTWIADARRYEDVQHALDLLETTAMLEPTRLKDAEGHKVDQPSPLATPTPAATPAASEPVKPTG
ncbi:hypothetical protein [Novosphingobium album (ex Hu et al. 2023)]|uniref:Uncharacterized protein n=1 Tax=Novosphingobium album (ex Hu et al. 2023) TaxID=2930093 RepID=A0ABT0AZK8_9SPHN|nr:hypothetical protein [Novosphingobium album (ex Hu et al. 2023)]MCJ2178223.1 hypothetical protein [Novosphingobium album (ex Hu et al. 2023)]